MKTETINLSQISLNERNPRKISDFKLKQLVRSILIFPEMLTIRPIAIDETYKTLGGNMRCRALTDISRMTNEQILDELSKTEGFKKKTEAERNELLRYWERWVKNPIAVIVRADKLTESQKREFIIKDNVSFGEWDDEILEEDFDHDELVDWGFDDSELELEDNSKEGEVVEDDFKEEDAAKAETRAKPGDIWKLGEHRLMCGDSTDVEVLKKLMGGVMADLYITDPPYNVDYVGKTKDSLKIKNDKFDDSAAFREFLCDAFHSADEVLNAGAAFYIFHADSEGYNFREAVKNTGWLMKQCLIWNKNSMVMGRQDYQWKHEPILYGWKEGASHHWYNDRKQTTIIDFNKPTRSANHPTMKPVGLFAYLISNSSKKGDIVLDTFGGSGTTIIACEQLERKCNMMELDPHYCDVIIARWEKMTGGKAIKL